MKWIKKVAATPLSNVAKDSLEVITNDRTNAPSIHAVNEAVNSHWLSVYPVGSIYINVNNVDPAEIFGGTWEQIKDKFLLACGDTYNNGISGGSASNTLTTAEIPSHSHSYTRATGAGNHTLTTAEIPSHSHSYTKVSGTIEVTEGGTSTALAGGILVDDTGSAGSGGAHNHPITSDTQNTGNAGTNGAHNHPIEADIQDTSSVGNGESINNMPPYLAVNVWVRRA